MSYRQFDLVTGMPHRQRADLVDILTSGKMPYRLEDVAKLTDREIQEQWLWDRQREGGVAHLVPAASSGQPKEATS